MNFENFLEWLRINCIEPRKTKTLAEQSSFKAIIGNDGRSLTIEFGSEGRSGDLSENDLHFIWKRYRDLGGSKHMTSEYNNPKWPETPSLILAPYVPALIRDFERQGASKKMIPPNNTKLPFFAYGIFGKGELAFLSIMDLVKDVDGSASVKGHLRLRDGLPILNSDLDPDDQADVVGSLIYFKDNHSIEAYERINRLEPDKQYIWMETETKQNIKCNYLIGKDPMKGSVPADEGWNGKDDPLFTDALEVIEETLDDNKGLDRGFKPMFKLQMAYLLLWSAIERYASLRYHIGGKPWDKIKHIADDDIFKELLHENVEENVGQYRQVQRADDPTCQGRPESVLNPAV